MNSKIIRAAALALLTLLALAGATAHAAADENVALRRAAPLRETPSDTARSLADLPALSAVVRSGERQGGWVQVRTAQGMTGWVSLFDLTTPAAASTSLGSTATSALRGLGSLLGGAARPPTAVSSTTAVSGIRGLGAEDLAQAQPNLEAVGRAEGLRVDAQAAVRFAATAPLVARSIDPLPEPATRPAVSSGGPRGGGPRSGNAASD